MTLRVIRLKGLQEKTGLGRSTVYDRLDPKSSRFDPSFPKPISLGASAVGWVEAEVDDWISSRIRASRPAEHAAM